MSNTYSIIRFGPDCSAAGQGKVQPPRRVGRGGCDASPTDAAPEMAGGCLISQPPRSGCGRNGAAGEVMSRRGDGGLPSATCAPRYDVLLMISWLESFSLQAKIAMPVFGMMVRSS